MGVAHSAIGPTTVVVLGDSTPTEDTWRALLDWLESRAEIGELSLLIVSHGGAPSASQRQSLVERVLRPHPVRAAIITDSSVVRGAAAAMSWFLDYAIECFLPREPDRALAYLEVPDPQRVLEAVAAQETSLGLPRLFSRHGQPRSNAS